MRSLFIALVVVNILVFASIWVVEAPSSPTPGPRSAPESAGARLQLLDESELEPSGSRSIHSPLPSGSGGEGTNMCTMVGPFGQLLHAEYLVDRLTSMDVAAVIRSIEVPDGMGYWVYLPPEVSDAAALRRLYEVQAKKIDSYIIPTGELARGISLGIYSEKAEADTRLREIIDQGYQPAMREVARTVSETWVSLPAAQGESIDPRVWMELLRQSPGLEKRQNFCPGVAPH